MNAVNHVSTPGKFKWLLKREYWENRGGFFWAPVVAGGISLLLSLMAIIAGVFLARRADAQGKLSLYDHDGIRINGLDLGMLTQQLRPEDIARLSEGMNATLALSSAWPFIVLAFVVFFYCLGALYDDRRDRSVLFWKSMPLSDTQTVLSKVVSALVVAPLLAMVASIVTMFGFLLMVSIVVVAHGGGALLIWELSNPMQIAAGALAWVPVYVLWALPTAGWLLLCSAWARSKPFLWAVMLPVFSGVIVSWFGVMKLFGLNAGWFWSNVVGRLLLGTVPGIEMVYRGQWSNDTSQTLLSEISPRSQLATLAMPELWLGALVGIAFIAAAIWLRSRRDEI